MDIFVEPESNYGVKCHLLRFRCILKDNWKITACKGSAAPVLPGSCRVWQTFPSHSNTAFISLCMSHPGEPQGVPEAVSGRLLAGPRQGGNASAIHEKWGQTGTMYEGSSAVAANKAGVQRSSSTTESLIWRSGGKLPNRERKIIIKENKNKIITELVT